MHFDSFILFEFSMIDSQSFGFVGKFSFSVQGWTSRPIDEFQSGENRSSFFYQIKLFIYSSQTLEELHLANNNFGVAGAYFIGRGLKNNNVRENLKVFSLNSIRCIWTLQSITVLDLTGCDIDEEGTTYIADALVDNQVTSQTFFGENVIYFLFFRNL